VNSAAARLTAQAVKAKAAEVGFDLCGIAPAVAHPKLARLAVWIAEGRAGDMAYLSDSLDERSDVTVMLPTARSVISLGCVYNTSAPYSTATPPGHAAIARYAWGDDYHVVLQQRVRTLLQWMADTSGPGLEALSCVDNGPVQERVFAEQAGLGWIGKNTCVISPALGSWIVLAAIVTNAELETDTPAFDQCGSCTRCLDACPTGAIVEPYTVDATKCLSYLTIESRSGVDETLRPFVEAQVFGCDICQDVCPWNRRAAVSDDPVWQPRPGLQSPALLDLCLRSDAEWSATIKASAMKRAGVRRIRRSLALAASHLPVSDAARALETMASQPSASHPDVAEAIAWARHRVVTPAAASSESRQQS
jgi:epoxyqueuosine reductase